MRIIFAIVFLSLVGCVSHPENCEAHFFYTKEKQIVWKCHDCGKDGKSETLNHQCKKDY
jgi:aspartate carbamoyltransferase regulatory subunit